MKLGIFDSGLGGLLISKAIRQHMPDIDMLYYGDTLHLPYGNRSKEAITHYTRKAMEAMFGQGCSLIVLACNSASAACLRTLQQEYLPAHWPDRNILGVVVPTLEEATKDGARNIGLIATRYMIESNIYEEELQKIHPEVTLQNLATPLLVPLIENGGEKWLASVLQDYLQQFNLSAMHRLILGCTHYIRLKPLLRDILPKHVDILSQDEVIPAKLSAYINSHPQFTISRNGKSEFFMSDITPHYREAARDLYQSDLTIKELNS